MAFGVGMVACLASCTDDRVSNPTLIEPEAGSFVLFQPEYSGSVVDLNNQDNPDYGIVLTWNQPTYTSNGAPIGFNAGAGTSYKVMISPSGLPFPFPIWWISLCLKSRKLQKHIA